jgi:hypothetical protein
MFYKFDNGQVIALANSPAVFGAASGVIPTPEEIEMYAGWYWFDTLEEANAFFGFTFTNE